MLNLILGRACDDKYKNITDILKLKIKENKFNNIIYIVPDQFKFSTEKTLISKLDVEGIMNIRVMSLSQYIYEIYTYLKLPNKQYIVSNIKNIILYKILVDIKDELKYFKYSENIDTIEQISRFLDNIRNVEIENIDPEQIDTKDILFKEKIAELKKIYNLYSNYLTNNKFNDETLYINQILENISDSKNEIKIKELLKTSIIFIDGYNNFSEKEYLYITCILKHIEEIYISLTLDNTDKGNKLNEYQTIFNQSVSTYTKITEIAKKNNIEIVETIAQKRKEISSEIYFLENNLFKQPFKTYKENVNDISVYLTKNPYTEIENIAIDILTRIRNSNGSLRYSDFSIMTNDTSKYSKVIYQILNQYNIPYYIDLKHNVSAHPIILYIVSLIKIIQNNFDNDSIFSYLKTGLVNIDYEDVIYIENYVIEFGIKWGIWQKEWNKNNKEQKYDIERVNNIRKDIISSILDFKKLFEGRKTALEISTKIYNHLNSVGITKKISEKVEELKRKKLFDEANIYSQVISKLFSILEDITIVYKNEFLTFDEYSKILLITSQDIKVSGIPSTIDEVFVGDIGKSKGTIHNYTYIIGANEGALPKNVSDNNFFNDNEIEIFKENNINIIDDSMTNLYKDMFNIYNIVGCTNKELIIYVPVMDISSESLRPSNLVYKLSKVLYNLKFKSDITQIESKDIQYYLVSKDKAIMELLLKIKNYLEDDIEIDESWIDLYSYLYENDKEEIDKIKNIIATINKLSINNNVSKELMQKMFSNDMKCGITQLELYSKCPFSYFMQNVLNIRERKEYKITNIDIGILMHNIIETFTDYIIKNKFRWEEILENKKHIEILDNIIANILKEDSIFMDGLRNVSIKNRLIKNIRQVIETLIYQQINSEFKIYDSEVEFGENKKFEHIVIQLDENKKLLIRGKIDRLDYADIDNKKYFRIIDFKSSKKDLKLKEVEEGLNLQLFTYMYAILNQNKIENMPAGMFYFNMSNQIIQLPGNNHKDEDIEKRILNNFKLKGIAIENVNILAKMDKNINDENKKHIDISCDGKSKGRLLDDKTFIYKCNNIKKILAEIGNNIYEGKFDISPKTKTNICEYCKYIDICNKNICKK